MTYGFQRYCDILRTYKTGKELATSSLLFKKPYLDLMEAEDVLSKEGHLPSAGRDMNADPEDGDPDDDELDAVEDLEELPSNVNQQTAIARAATRIALYMMREELGESDRLGVKQHAHDFFVVNSCKVYCKVKVSASSDTNMNGISEVENTASTESVDNQGHLKMDVIQRKVSSDKWCEGIQSGAVLSGEACCSKQQADVAGRNQGDISSPSSQSVEKETVDVMGTDETNRDKWGTVQNSEADQGGKHVSDQSHASATEIKRTGSHASASQGLDALMPITRKDAMKVLEEINR